MYWEALGFPGSAPSSTIEDLARWVQWAESGIMAGASDQEENIRFNLSSFWNDKAAAYPGFSEAERYAANKLDIRAHGLLEAMDEGLIWSRSPSYWSYWRSWWASTFTGRPASVDRPGSEALAEEAKQAARDAAAGAEAAGSENEADYFRTVESQVDRNAANAAGFWKAQGADLGIPGGISGLLMMGAGILALYLWSKER